MRLAYLFNTVSIWDLETKIKEMLRKNPDLKGNCEIYADKEGSVYMIPYRLKCGDGVIKEMCRTIGERAEFIQIEKRCGA